MVRKKYTPHLVVDGNFKLENLRMRRPQDDVALRDGRGYMVGSVEYREHLQTTIETTEVGGIILH